MAWDDPDKVFSSCLSSSIEFMTWDVQSVLFSCSDSMVSDIISCWISSSSSVSMAWDNTASVIVFSTACVVTQIMRS